MESGSVRSDIGGIVRYENGGIQVRGAPDVVSRLTLIGVVAGEEGLTDPSFSSTASGLTSISIETAGQLNKYFGAASAGLTVGAGIASLFNITIFPQQGKWVNIANNSESGTAKDISKIQRLTKELKKE